MAVGRSVVSEVARHSAPARTPLRRGAVVAALTGGAVSLVGVATTIPLPLDPAPVDPAQLNPGLIAAAATLPASEPAAPESDAAEPPTSLLPVASGADGADAERLDTAKLVKAVQLAEREATRDSDERASERPDTESDDESDDDAADEPSPTETPKSGRAASGASDCDLDSSQLGAVKPHVRTAANFLGCRYGEPTVLGVAGRAGNSDHPSGKALDFMVDRATGNGLAACALRNQEELGISYVIWRQRINFGEGWQPMEDRGGPTANHLDHVHVSFESAAGGRPSAC